jgi:hypothetical protein
LSVITALGFAAPVALYLWLIHQYGVNVIYADQWVDVNVVGHAYSGTLGFSTLWAQHNENRILFPNLIVLALAYTTHLNILVEEYLGALMLFGATALFILTHKRSSPSRPWIYYCPVAILVLSVVQSGNAIWGFQMAWYLVMLMLAVTLWLLERSPMSRWVLLAAIVAAVVGSYSSLQGLLIWPAGLFLMYMRHRPRRQTLTWCGAGVATGILYVINFDFRTARSPDGSVIDHPVHAIAFFFKSIGDVVGSRNPGAPEMLLGIVIFLVALWTLFRYGRRPDPKGASPLGLSLIVYGLIFALMIAYGRSGSGPLGNLEPRFTVYVILILVGIYLALLDAPPSLAPAGQGDKPPRASGDLVRATTGEGQVDRYQDSGPHPGSPRSRRWLQLVRVAVGLAIILQVGLGIGNGISSARTQHQVRLVAADVLVNIDKAPDTLVFIDVNPLSSVSFARRMAAIARLHHLSVFGTSDAARYRRMGLDCPAKTLHPSRTSCRR